MIIYSIQPMPIKEMVQTRSLSYRPSQVATVRVRNPYSVEPTATEAPCNYVAHVKNPLVAHPRENAIPHAIWTLWILRISRAIRCPWDFDNDAGPSSLDKLVGPLGIVRTISIKACEKKYGGNTVLGTGFGRNTSIHWYYWLISTRCSGVWDPFLDHGIDPAADGFGVCIFLRFPGLTSYVGIDDREA